MAKGLWQLIVHLSSFYICRGLIRRNLIGLEAICLDGSPAAYYFEDGNEKTLKWFIFFEGGGWCHNLETCFERASSHLGSSKQYPTELSLESTMNYFSKNNSKSIFYGWNIVFVKYCDGGSFTGDNATVYNGTKLHFKGKYIVLSLIEEMKKIGCLNATDIVIGGLSAGGLSAVTHVDRFAASFPNALVTGLPDAAFFLPVDKSSCNYLHQMKNIYEMMNASDGIHPRCRQSGINYKCMFAFNILPYVISPLFILQSRYDIFVLPFIGCVSLSNVKKSKEFSMEFTLQFYRSFQNSSSYSAAFLDSCPHHGPDNIHWVNFDAWNVIPSRTNETGHTLYRRWYHEIKKSYKNDQHNKRYSKLLRTDHHTVPWTKSVGSTHLHLSKYEYPDPRACG